MIPETGLFALILALCLCVFQLAAGMGGRRLPASHQVLRRACALTFACVCAAFAALLLSYLRSDFSVAVVADNSYTLEPLLYRVTATWGNHEGSMLLWLLVLTGFGCIASRNAGSLTMQALLVQAALALGVILYILLTSNPFARLFPPASNGQELNPLLQDIGLAIHPPLLYLGYVGFSLVFSFAVAGLMAGKINRGWARIVHPWILAAWTCLTAGIALGSWWAYRELGWGGFWFWDPVENISLMPWLSGTALLHANIVLMRRGQLARWVALLAILTFSLSLMGTFLVRSGLLTSVHSFASDPWRGMFILAYISLSTGGALVFYSLRAPSLEAQSAPVSFLSREGFLLFNNLLLVAACATVALATLYPLIMEAFELGGISIGPPYYNTTVLPILSVALLFAGLAPLLPWGGIRRRQLRRQVGWLLAVACIAALGGAMLARKETLFSAAAFALAAWTGGGGIFAWWKAAGPASGLRAFARVPLHMHGMMLSHLGAGIVVAAIAGASLWTTQHDQPLKSGDHFSVAGYDFAYLSREEVGGPNYKAQRANFSVGAGIMLAPEIRHYPVRDSYTTEAAIHSSLFCDIYMALGRALDGGDLSVRVYIRPMIGWLWAGVAFIALGGMLAWIDRTRRNS